MLDRIVAADADPGLRPRKALLQRRSKRLDPRDQVRIGEAACAVFDGDGVGPAALAAVEIVDGIHSALITGIRRARLA